MASQAAIHKRNLESAILFMQSEHADTLKGLHEEIKNLQKKCSDLTFQLNMQGLGIEVEGNVDTKSELESRFEQEIKAKKDLELEVQLKDKKIKEYEQLVKRQKMKTLEEMRSKNQEIDHLKADLESKSNQVAYLTTELHKHKRLALENSASGAFLADAKILPAPPKEQPHHLRIQRSHRLRQSKPTVDPEELERHPVRYHSGRSSSTSRSTSPVELAKPFLRKGEEAAKIDVKERQPLPPIRASTGIEDHRQQVFLQKVLPSSAHNPTKAKKTQEVHVLAVDQVSKSDNKWAHAHSSEYNS